MASPTYDYVFPAADSIAAQQAIGSASVDPASLMNQINTSETGNLFDSLNSAAGNSSQALTYGMYMYRNKTISDIANDLTNKNKSMVLPIHLPGKVRLMNGRLRISLIHSSSYSACSCI